MNTDEFHSKMKQHCDKLNGECSQCCFLEYCYSQKRDVYGAFLDEVVNRLSENAVGNTDKCVRVIRNPNNVFADEGNSQRR